MELAITKNTQRLKELENVITRNLQSFYEVGRALMEIRDNELYKVKNGGGYGTFEAYCQDTWNFNSSRARQFISATETVDNIKSVTTVTPSSERQTRPLAKLEPVQQKEVWKRAVDTAPEGKITASHVEKIVNEVTGEKGTICQDSDAVFQLKRWWRKATIKDKKIFIQWTNNN